MDTSKITDICITRSNKQIPSTIATQHPDNAARPFWHECPPTAHGCEYISTADEIRECYVAFKELDCQEYMWDWEGKFVDEGVIDRLFSKYLDYFKKQQLGRNRFLTFRIPNLWKEDTVRVPRAFMAILTANDAARRLGLNNPPIFEVILPQTDDASELIFMQEKFQQISIHYCEIFEQKCDMKYFSIIPLIETSRGLIESKKMLAEYLDEFEKKFNCGIDNIRPFIARSDPALAAGFVPAVIAAKTAISEYYKFEKETGIKVYPMIGAGALHFRGGLNPRAIGSFIENYSGVRTVTIQSAFRYDYPLDEVKEAIRKLNGLLPNNEPVIHEEQRLSITEQISKSFWNYYRRSLESIVPLIVRVASFVPAHRERMPFSGDTGYGRFIEGINAKLPRAITFTAAFYSLGVPPEFIGTGRGIKATREEGKMGVLEGFHMHLKEDLAAAGNFLNKKNLASLAGKIGGFRGIQEDITYLEKYLDREIGPYNEEGNRHREETGKILDLIEKDQDPVDNILAAGRLRRSLG